MYFLWILIVGSSYIESTAICFTNGFIVLIAIIKNLLLLLSNLFSTVFFIQEQLFYLI